MSNQLPEHRGTSQGLARVLTALAGGSGVWRQKRRGSFLILVVGTLALLAVISILYVTIGTQDTRTRAAADRREQIDEVPQRFADYVANQVIGPDTLSVWFDDKTHTTSSGQVFLRRKTMTYPSIDWMATSSGSRADARAFNVVASADASTAITQDLQRFMPTTPWLASPEPTYLDFERNGPSDASGNPPRTYLDNRDWAQISNFAPDGRFVNLVNLRNNFSATHDQMTGVAGSSSPPSLLDDRAMPTNVTDFRVPADVNYPAFFTARQRGAFLPSTYRISGVGPGDAAFLTNQWADADGDGFLDSRFMELVDPRNTPLGSAGDLLGVNTSGYRYFFAVRAIDLSGLVNVNTATDSVSAPTGTAPWGISPADVDLRRLLTLQDSYENYADGSSTRPGGYDALASRVNPEADYSGRSGQVPYDRTEAFYAGVGAYSSLRLALASGSTVPGVIFDISGQPLYLASYTPNDRRVNTDLFSIKSGLGNPISSNPMTLSISDTELKKIEAWNTWAPATGFTTSALLGAERRLETYREAAQANDGVIRIDANNLQAQGLFGSDSLQELLTLRGLNDERALSPLEVTLSGRDGSNITQYPTSGVPGSLRFSPLRSNRPFDDEAYFYTTIDRTPNSPYDRTMLQVASDVRHLLTTVSGARQFRSVPVSNNRQISAAELKIDASAAAAGGDVKTLFRGYADALALDSDRTSPMSPWVSNTTNVTEHHMLDTLFYGGRGPEAALHIAAHMAVNMSDSVDGDTTPSVYALVTCPSDARNVATTERGLAIDMQVLDNETYGYDAMSGAAKPNNLSLPDSRLATSVSGQLNAGSITKIYGVEPQPFITEVASFTVYFDAPPGTPGTPPGDDELNTSIPPDPNTPITIDGTTTSADCLYRVLAFQLTNPFDQDITLNEGGVIRGKLNPTSGPGAEQDITQYYNFNPGAPDHVSPRLDLDKSFYYINYGGNLFKLVAMDQPSFVPDPQVTPMRNNGLPALSGGPTAVGNYVDTSDTGSGGPGSFGKERVTLSTITIPAGGSVVLCSLSRDLPTRIYDKVKDIGAAVPTRVQNRPGEIKNLVWRSIPGGASQAVYFIPRVDPMNWNLQINTTPLNDNTVFMAGASGPTPVYLYRAVREGKDPTTGNDAGDAKHDFPRPVDPGAAAFWDGVTKAATYPDPNTSYGPNNMANDQLVDRFIPDGNFNSNRKLADGSQMIIGSMSGVDNYAADGFTITYFSASVRPASGPGALAPGGIPGYCIQPKYVANWNQSLTDGAPTTNPSKAVFTATPFDGAAKTFESFHTTIVPRSSTTKFAKMLQTAEDRTSIGQIGSGGDLRHNANIPETASAAYSSNAPVVFSSGGSTSLKAVRSGLPASSAGKPVVRLADLLLPLGVGPEFTPYKPGTTTRYDLSQPAEAMVAWTTLSEALASAMGYDEAVTYPAPVGTADPKQDSTFLFAPIDSGSGDLRLMFDRVTLRTDDFVPFIDANSDGLFTPGPSEYRVGLELPLALNIMDQFTTVPATQAIDRAVPGLININTAPMAVLRVIPGLAPLPYDPTNPMLKDPTGNFYWWRPPADGYTGAQPPAGLVGNTTPGSVVDIASTIAAYRDKGPVWRRVGSTTPMDQTVDFREPAMGFPRVDYNNNSTYGLLSGRAEANQLGWTRPSSGGPTLDTGISELPGLRSIGEIMGARVWDTMRTPAVLANHYNIDFMAYDGTLPAGQLNSAIGFETGAPTDPSAYATYKTKAKPISSREKLALANVAFNSLTTRSDYFAVWFIVQGYKKSDVTGLGMNDPMIPSVRRRFLMVVDRSNVIKVGDKPRVVLFKEVPVVDTIPAQTN
ncbi:MAG: hypothetical protein GC200_03535 [Tepidisphaera sp.]|nr:hypothetical protein [Tepidisphaera sp.]